MELNRYNRIKDNGQEVCENILSCPNYHENAAQNHNDIKGNRSWSRFGEARPFLQCWWDCKNNANTMEKVLEFAKD